MNKSFIWRFCLLAPVLLFLLAINSCSSTKRVQYFQDIPDSGKIKTIPAAIYNVPKIQEDDILSVLIQTVDPLATQSINSGNTSVSGSSSSSGIGSGALGQLASAGVSSAISQSQLQPTSGYLVDKSGNINIPILGKVHAVGYTTSQLKDTIFKLASKYYNDPNVIVRFANFKVSVTGEVARPGVYIMPNEKVSFMDAITMAGDLTIYGKRDNLLLIRENTDGTKSLYRVDLRKSAILASPYYYLRQNDIIYVQPSSSKAASTDAAQARNYTIIGSILSLIAIYITRK
jgi:polysaccharide export outer membrane protein